MFLSKDTATSRPDNVADKTLFSTGALFSEVFCFLLDESVLSEVTFGVSLLGTSCLFSGTVCPLGTSFLSVSFTDSLLSFLSSAFAGSLFSFLVSVTFSSLGVTFLVSSFTDSLFSFLSSVIFSSFGFSISTKDLLFKEFSKIDFTF